MRPCACISEAAIVVQLRGKLLETIVRVVQQSLRFFSSNRAFFQSECRSFCKGEGQWLWLPSFHKGPLMSIDSCSWKTCHQSANTTSYRHSNLFNCLVRFPLKLLIVLEDGYLRGKQILYIPISKYWNIHSLVYIQSLCEFSTLIN